MKDKISELAVKKIPFIVITSFDKTKIEVYRLDELLKNNIYIEFHSKNGIGDEISKIHSKIG